MSTGGIDPWPTVKLSQMIIRPVDFQPQHSSSTYSLPSARNSPRSREYLVGPGQSESGRFGTFKVGPVALPINQE